MSNQGWPAGLLQVCNGSQVQQSLSVPTTRLPTGQKAANDERSLGHQRGTGTVKIGTLQQQAHVAEWNDIRVRTVLPQFPLAADSSDVIVMFGANREIAELQ